MDCDQVAEEQQLGTSLAERDSVKYREKHGCGI